MYADKFIGMYKVTLKFILPNKNYFWYRSILLAYGQAKGIFLT